MADITWTKIDGISLATAAREAGFDLAVYDAYSPNTREELRRRSIKIALEALHDSFEEQTERSLSEVDRGVYVISVGWPFAIRYRGGVSDVIYIGIGRVAGRLKSHFENSLFDLMQSLQGVEFSFYISEPRLPRVEGYYKHIEYLMLRAFKLTIGNNEQYPLLNSNAGAKKNVKATKDGWKLPLKRTGRRPRWLIEPTRHNEFAPLD